jgi:hypothetical protein
VKGIADLKLGLAEEFGIGLAGQQPSQTASLGQERLLQRVEESLGEKFLFGSEQSFVHDNLGSG